MSQYIVQPGDNPSKIAKKFGLTLAQFQRLNPGLCTFGSNECRVIFPGQVVQVSGTVTGLPAEGAQPGAAGGAGFAAPPPWMQIAIMEVGVQEWQPGDNPRIQQYLASVGLPNKPDETAWCAAFVNWCLEQAGFRGARSGRVSDWWGWGRPVAATYGAVCILQPLGSDQATSGHIGFLHAMDATNVWLLSGNSKNSVRISAYPKNKLIHNAPYRWPY
ncbi:MAG TPA: TIGR02594 family protein [Prosthecobacter sp.]|nr:TIGR02594 family protein [Prosthecobacter sp.]